MVATMAAGQLLSARRLLTRECVGSIAEAGENACVGHAR